MNERGDTCSFFLSGDDLTGVRVSTTVGWRLSVLSIGAKWLLSDGVMDLIGEQGGSSRADPSARWLLLLQCGSASAGDVGHWSTQLKSGRMSRNSRVRDDVEEEDLSLRVLAIGF